MVKQTCPGCGAPYNGKKCRACGFQPFGIDGVRSIQVRKRISAKAHKKQRTVVGSLVGFLMILMLIAVMLPALRNWGFKLDAIEAIHRTPEPIPGNPTVLFRQDPITVLVPEQDSPSVSLWFYNHGKEDAVVVCREIAVNGDRMEHTSLSVYVPAGSAVKGTLPEPESPADEFTFSMEAKTPNGEFLFETGPIQLKGGTVSHG